MAVVHFITSTGDRRSIEIDPGQSLMQLATANLVPGIEASCGGYCSCATCHVYVDPAWADKLPPISEDENDLLDGAAAERLPNSRLSCQVKLTEDLDGISITIPDRQS
ncbi:MAG: 2Fe-2S iron-sulfur cluster-binding protein [Acidocella sp.]|nr:2Fe-2S iron-sulfur cluster-binding protein [Acidocella sp.]